MVKSLPLWRVKNVSNFLVPLFAAVERYRTYKGQVLQRPSKAAKSDTRRFFRAREAVLSPLDLLFLKFDYPLVRAVTNVNMAQTLHSMR